MDLKSISKFLSYVLRHHPESIGLDVDEKGWAEVSELVEKAQHHGRAIERDQIHKVISKGAKQRFLISSDGKYIRAGYGHSIDVNLQLKPKSPPEKLYHGTAREYVDSILTEGIKALGRNFVHLSTTIEEARNVGGRHGKPVVLCISSKQMIGAGYDFYQSESGAGIWLTEHVPPHYIQKQ